MAAVEGGQFGHKAKTAEFTACGCHQLGAGCCCTTGGQEIVDHQHLLAPLEGITADLESIGAVFQGVIHSGDGARQLAGFAHGHKTKANGCG